MYRVFLTNHDYFAHDTFATFQEALEWAKSHSFEVSIWHGDEIVATWSPINGISLLNEKRRTK